MDPVTPVWPLVLAGFSLLSSFAALGLGFYLLIRGTEDIALRKAFEQLEDEWESAQKQLKKDLGRVSRMKQEATEAGLPPAPNQAAPQAQPPADPYDRAALYAYLKGKVQ